MLIDKSLGEFNPFGQRSSLFFRPGVPEVDSDLDLSTWKDDVYMSRSILELLQRLGKQWTVPHAAISSDNWMGRRSMLEIDLS